MHKDLVHYDLFAISRVLPTVPRMRLSCIFCTWFPLRRSEDTPVEHPLYHLPELQGGLEGNPREMRSAVVNELHGGISGTSIGLLVYFIWTGFTVLTGSV